MRNIKFIFVMLSIIITFLICSCYSYRKSYYTFIIGLEDQILQNNENVLFAEALFDGSDGWGEIRISMFIVFKDKQWMCLYDVGYTHGYNIVRHKRNLNNGEVIVSTGFHTDLKGDSMEDILSNINHIIQNFDIMAAYMEKLEDMDSNEFKDKKDKFKDKDSEWFWSDEAGLEKEIIGDYEQIALKYRTRRYFLEGYIKAKEKWRQRLQLPKIDSAKIEWQDW